MHAPYTHTQTVYAHRARAVSSRRRGFYNNNNYFLLFYTCTAIETVIMELSETSDASDTSHSTSIDSELSTSFCSSESSCSLDSDSTEVDDSDGSYRSTSDDDDAHLNCDDIFQRPLYEGAKLTVFESYLHLMQYTLRHGLTKQASSDLLSLVAEHLPSETMVSIYKLRKFFQDTYGDISFNNHYCCSKCHTPLPDPKASCTNGCDKSSALQFLTVPVETQLIRKLEGI